MRDRLPALVVDHPVTVLMTLLASVVLGLLAWDRIPLQMMPEGFEPGFLWIQVPWPNASPLEVDESIVRPVEEQLGTVPGIQRLVSRAQSDSATFQLEFYSSVDMDDAYDTVSDRLERALVDLPTDVERTFIFRYNPNSEPVVWTGVSLPESLDDPHYVLDRVVKPRLERVPGVASVEIFGVPQRAVYVDYDKEAVYSHGIDLGSVQRKLSSDRFQMASGRVEDRGRIHNVRGLSSADTLEALRETPVQGDLRLRDLAEVELRAARSTTLWRIDGKEAASLAVQKESSANAVAVSEAVAEVFAELEADPRTRGARFFTFFDQGDLVGESVSTLTDTALTGGLLAVVILYLFLREWRMTLLIAGCIPLSMLMTVAVLYLQGGSLNLISLMGLMLAVGMVVDNAIVVVETIYRRRMDGETPRQAAVGGVGEVWLAILASTATTMVVFLPVILMSENAMFSFFLGELGLPVVYALGASLVAALIFVPLTTVGLSQGAIRPDAPWLQALADRYASLLGWALRRRSDSGTSLFVLAALTAGLILPSVQCAGEVEENLNDFGIRFSVPPQASMADRDQILGHFEAFVESHREEWGVRVYRGRLGGDDDHGQVVVYLVQDGPLPREEVMDRAREALPRDLPGVEATVGWGGEEGGGGNSLSLTVYGEDLPTLRELAEEIGRRVRPLPGVLDVDVDLSEGGRDEIQLVIDRPAISRYGVSAQGVGGLVSYAMRGSRLPDLRTESGDVSVQAAFALEDRSRLDDLLDFEVFSPTLGTLVPVRSVTQQEVVKAPDTIRRDGRRTSTTVTLDLAEGLPPDEVGEAINGVLADLEMPRGTSWSRGQEQRRQEEDNAATGLALLLSVCFVFLLMGMLFESFLLPLAIITTVPMAMLGAVWGLVLTGTPMDTMAGVGLVILVGVVVNNGIVLVDLVEQLRSEGMARDQALVEAGRRRLRPILMTALTTIAGLLPMALGGSSFIGIPYAPLGRVVIGGMIASTLLTLVFVPYLYVILDEARTAGRSWWAWTLGRGA